MSKGVNTAVFLDRDGVINELVFNPATGEYEAPHYPDDYRLFPYVVDAIKILINHRYLLFLMSNQPDYAKGKTSMENLRAIHERMHKIFLDNGIVFTHYYYCYHHPDGVVPEYTKVCECRKPSPYFLRKAEREYNLDLKRSWLIGDQDSDILSGKDCGIKTILLDDVHSTQRRGNSKPEYKMHNLQDAVELITNTHIK